MALILVLLTMPLPAVRANVIGIETYMGHGDLAYSGDLQIQGQQGVVQGKVYRAPGLQRTDFAVRGVAFGALVDLAANLGTLWSPAYRAYAVTPLTQAGVRDWVPQLQHHSQVSIVPAAGETAPQVVNGVEAWRHDISGFSPEGTSYSGQLWATAEGVIVRLVARIAGVEGPVVYDLTNLRLGAQAPGLFAKPAGYQQRSWAEASSLLGH